LVNAMHHGNLEVDSELRDSKNEQDYYDAIRDRKQAAPFCHRRVRVEAEFSDKHICVQITDEGKGFDVSSIADPCSGASLHCVSGRGLFLIRSFMDQVKYGRQLYEFSLMKNSIAFRLLSNAIFSRVAWVGFSKQNPSTSPA